MPNPVATNVPAYVQAVREHAAIQSRYYNGIWIVKYKGAWITNEDYERVRIKPESLLKVSKVLGETIGSTLTMGVRCAVNY